MPSRGAVPTGAQRPLIVILGMVDRPHQAGQLQAVAFVRGPALKVVKDRTALRTHVAHPSLT